LLVAVDFMLVDVSTFRVTDFVQEASDCTAMAPDRYAQIFPATTLDIVALFVTPCRSFTDNALSGAWVL